MSFKRIIPCLDTTVDESGKPLVVKGVEFEGLRYAGDPLSLAKKYDSQGADEIIFLDITASIEKRRTMLNVVREVSQSISVPLGVGGGISSIEEFKQTIEAGAAKVSMNTAAVKTPSLVRLVSSRFGNSRTVVAIDCKSRTQGVEERTSLSLPDGKSVWYEVVILGGRQPTGLDAVEWAKKVQELGAGEILLTSKDRDGTKMGYDLTITRAIAEAVDIPIIASGGVGEPEHMCEAFRDAKADACLAASIFHYDEYTIAQVKEYLREQGIPVKT
ncbi:MAG: imidazole glycerol phosphate synthase subunit HisF [Candidatus Bathyarchaeota archaeon]|nr:MAG: imidazole glycerol phosphate synthase subunit HisF [Candidatus Bathyarchaeota archaeon]